MPPEPRVRCRPGALRRARRSVGWAWMAAAWATTAGARRPQDSEAFGSIPRARCRPGALRRARRSVGWARMAAAWATTAGARRPRDSEAFGSIPRARRPDLRPWRSRSAVAPGAAPQCRSGRSPRTALAPGVVRPLSRAAAAPGSARVAPPPHGAAWCAPRRGRGRSVTWRCGLVSLMVATACAVKPFPRARSAARRVTRSDRSEGSPAPADDPEAPARCLAPRCRRRRRLMTRPGPPAPPGLWPAPRPTGNRSARPAEMPSRRRLPTRRFRAVRSPGARTVTASHGLPATRRPMSIARPARRIAGAM